ncbi:DNA-binding protein [Bombiscardovia nodaiensis]|uniref:DNA-binding protein n=1 Tax=Bombiscardovia nodaiensis TaxID=2932181 RepID=A0ABM8B9D4_9BIFI|nr:DNA-binding protein [Bombiscardovia nodaiensis]
MTNAASSPWAVSVAQLAQQAGQSKTIDANFPAPSGIGDEIVGVSEGEPVHVSGSLDSIVDGLILNAHISAPLHAVCTRCLKPLSGPKELDVVAFFPYEMPEEKDEGQGEVEIVAGEEEAGDGNTYPLAGSGTLVDLEALLRDNLVESIPLKVLCKPDCKGLCSQCGIDLNEHPDHHHDIIDGRWSALEGLKAQLEQGTDGSQSAKE